VSGRTFHVLIFPGGTEIGLEVHKSLCHLKNVRLYSAGQDVSQHAPYVFHRHCIVPGVHEPDWLEHLNRVIRTEAIDYVFPAHDDVLEALARNEAELGCRVVTSPPETCLVCRSKSLTHRRLADAVPMPRLYEDWREADPFPVFVKPDRGQGSRGAAVARDRGRLAELMAESPDLLVSENLPGAEYTVDCFSDREAGLLFCAGRARIRTRNGISMHCRSESNEVFREYARAISGRLTFHGAWFFQVKQDAAGCFKLLEAAPRIAGTMALHRVMGVNFPLLSLYEQERIPCEILLNPGPVELDRALVNRYRHQLDYAAVYVDLDDTLILDGRVHTGLVRFLYQSLNQGKRLVLLTRRRNDLYQTLQRYRLGGLFDQVVRVEDGECKADKIADSRAIFIDDSFSERLAVGRRAGIPTFDLSMIEMLMDDRA